MKCWKCGQNNDKGTENCVYCGNPMLRSKPYTEIGKTLRKLYDQNGAKKYSPIKT